MGSIATLIHPVAAVPIGYAERLLKDIKPEVFATKPRSGDKTIELNHPAFNYGHLSLYPQRVAGFLGISLKASVPAGYEAMFKDGTPCQDDPQHKIYPPMSEIVETFFESSKALQAQLGGVADEKFLAVMEDEKRRQRFPTVGAFVIYILSAHINGHLGQVSAWRRCMGLAAV